MIYAQREVRTMCDDETRSTRRARQRAAGTVTKGMSKGHLQSMFSAASTAIVDVGVVEVVMGGAGGEKLERAREVRDSTSRCTIERAGLAAARRGWST